MTKRLMISATLSLGLTGAACPAQSSSPPPIQNSDSALTTQTPTQLVPPGEDVYMLRGNNAHTTPAVQRYTINEGRVRDIHLRFGITTTVKTPSAITTIAVGDPYLFEAEHSADEPTIVLVKPRTHDQSNSNMVVVLDSGKTLSFRLLSVGDGNSGDVVDYMVDMQPQASMFRGGSDGASGSPAFTATPSPGGSGSTSADGIPGSLHNQLLLGLATQKRVATPVYQNAKQLAKLVKENENAPNTLAIALGKVQQDGATMTVSYSVMNISQSLVEVLPPQVQYSNPHVKKPKKNRGARAEQLPLDGYLTTERKLAPGQRCDGVLSFTRPNYKQYEEKLLLQVAAAAAIDFPLMLPLPFVAPGQE